MSLERDLRPEMRELANLWVQTGIPHEQMFALSVKADFSPSEAPNFFKVEQPLEEGEHSYLLTLQYNNDEDSNPLVLLSLEDFRTQDVGEQADILITRALDRVKEKWGNKAVLLRAGELRIRPHSVFELGVGNLRDSDMAMLDAISTNLPQMPRESISVQWD